MHLLVHSEVRYGGGGGGGGVYERAIRDTIMAVRSSSAAKAPVQYSSVALPPAEGEHLLRCVFTPLPQGGCNASRATFAGACLGAALGVEGLPAAWKPRATAYAEVEALALRLAAMRPG